MPWSMCEHAHSMSATPQTMQVHKSSWHCTFGQRSGEILLPIKRRLDSHLLLLFYMEQKTELGILQVTESVVRDGYQEANRDEVHTAITKPSDRSTRTPLALFASAKIHKAHFTANVFRNTIFLLTSCFHFECGHLTGMSFRRNIFVTYYL